MQFEPLYEQLDKIAEKYFEGAEPSDYNNEDRAKFRRIIKTIQMQLDEEEYQARHFEACVD